MRGALNLAVRHEQWVGASVGASNLSQLELTLGDTGASVRDGEGSVAYAARRGHAPQSIINHSTHANALHQAGLSAEAEARFVKAEAMQAEEQPEFPILYSLRGFHYCDLLLADAERGSWRQLLLGPHRPSDAELDSAKVPPSTVRRRLSLQTYGSRTSEELRRAGQSVAQRATQTLDIAEGADLGLLALGLGHLTLARAALYKSILGGERPSGTHMREAFDFLRHAAAQEFIPLSLLTSGLSHVANGDFNGARDDLGEAFEIAERGPMRLYLADIYLHRTRLFGLIANRPAAYPWVSTRDDLDKARKLIDECGDGRRREELEDAEAAWERVYGAAAPRAAN
jgi:hypothetical protein